MFECDFISGAANTVRGGTKWFTVNDVNYIAYACSNLVLIINESRNRVICSLKGHIKKVTCVTINQQNNTNIINDTNRFIEIVSAGDDGQIIVWRNRLPHSESINNNNNSANEDLIHWGKVIIATMKSPLNAIACVSTSSTNDSSNNSSTQCGTLVTAADAMGYVHSWLRLESSDVGSNDGNTSFQLVDEFKTHLSQNAYCLSLDCINIIDDNESNSNTDKTIVLFSGCLDSKIYVRTCSFNAICNKVVTSGKVEATVSSSATNIASNSENINANTINSTIPTTTTTLLPPSVAILKAESLQPPYSQSFTLRGTLQGHEEWVTCLHTIQLSSNVLMLASGSKDNKIRLWRIESSLIVSSSTSSTAKLLSETENVADPVMKVEEGEDKKSSIEDVEEDKDEDEEEHGGGGVLIEDEDDEVKNEARLNFKTLCIAPINNNNNNNSTTSPQPHQIQQQQKYVQHSIFLDALLVGHEDWVTSVHWMLLPSPPTLISNSDISNSNSTVANNSSIMNSNMTGMSSSSPATSFTTQQQLQLFSTSMDRNMVIWSTDSFTGAYTPRVRVGDIGGQLGGSVGANLLGFVSGCVSHDNRSLLGVGYGGSLHLWKQQQLSQSQQVKDANTTSSSMLSAYSSSELDGRWMPVPLTTGHFGSVNDCLWGGSSRSDSEKGGEYLVSVSSDQTCRMFAQCWLPQIGSTENSQKENNGSNDSNGSSSNNISSEYLWKEISRPQVHGYDLNSLVMIHHHKHHNNQSLVANIDNSTNGLTVNNTVDTATNNTNSTTTTTNINTNTHGGLPQYLVTVGDEKVVRVFTPPGIVIDGLATLCHIGNNTSGGNSSSNKNETVKIDDKFTDSSSANTATIQSSTTSSTATATSTVYRAYIPELGLSNLASELMSAQEQIEMNARNVTVMNWNNTQQQSPLESQLADYTIWPEYKKLYRHQNDVFCIAINHAQNMIVTASKAKDKHTAKILVWEVASSGNGGFNCIDCLEYHESTVVAMRFSACDTYLASTGKDRSLFIYYSQVKQTSQTQGSKKNVKYELCAGQKNAHKRIIWDCSWVPHSNTVSESSHHHLIVTVSRDGCAKVWKISESMSSSDSTTATTTSSTTVTSAATVVLLECVLTIASPFGVGVAVTSIDIHRSIFSNVNRPISSGSGSCLVLMGAENGCISLWKLVQHNQNPKHCSSNDDDATSTCANATDTVVSNEYEMVLVDSVSDYFNHGASVKRIRWASNTNNYMFASCGEDNTVRIFRYNNNDRKLN